MSGRPVDRHATGPARPRASVKAFTLTEMLIVTALVTLIAGTVMALVSSGARVWERFERSGVKEQWILVAMEQMGREVRNARRFSPVPFRGAYDEMSFASLLPSAETDAPAELGRTAYFFDDRQHRLCRAQQPYRGLRHARARDACAPILEDVQRLRFEYFGTELEDGEPSWSTSWKHSAPPLAVKIELGYLDSDDKLVSRSRIIHLPTAQP